MVDKDLKTLICTSSIPEEGKTTTISNLAVTLAQQGQKVLLVDADLRKPTVHQVMGVDNRNGLTNLLTKKVKADLAILQPMENISLYVLPSGPIPPNPAEILGSKMMEGLIDELAVEYDMILFDTPPVLAVADAQILSGLCDGVILVVRSHQTEKKNLVRAKELLDRGKCNLLGTIFNGVSGRDVQYYYYYQEER